MTVANTPGTEDWVEIVAHEDGGWEWDFVGLWYSPSARRYFGYSDSGCSCNWWTQGFSVANCEDGDKQWAVAFVAGDNNAEKAVRAFNPQTLS